MSDIPDQLTLKGNRDREGKRDVQVRRAFLSALVLLLALGLSNLFGQRPSTTTADADAASLAVYAPERVRGGLFYEARFTVDALGDPFPSSKVREVRQPLGEASRDGDLVFELGRIPAGEKHVLFAQLQVNPTNVGHRSQDVRLYDGDRLLATVDRSITIFP